jgi:uroporphyrinogen-III synthase
MAARVREKTGAKSPYSMTAGHNLGKALVRAGRAAEGEQMLRETYEARAATVGPAAKETLSTLEILAATVGERGDKQEQARLLQILDEARQQSASRAASRPSQ